MNSTSRQRSVRMLLVQAMVLIGSGLAAFLIRNELYQFYRIEPRVVLTFVGGSIGVGAMILAMLYLRGDIRIPGLERLEQSGPDLGFGPDQDALDSLMSSVETLSFRLTDLEGKIEEDTARAEVRLSDDERTEMMADVKRMMPASLAHELRSQFEEEVAAVALRSRVSTIFDAADRRLRQEIAALTRRGNLNLIIGVFTTIAAVGLLAYMVLGVSTEIKTVTELLQYYVPRVSTAAFIEIFSFFFLRLYRSSLSEIRYYQDELTRLSQSRVVLLAAEASEDGETLADAIRLLANGRGAVRPSDSAKNLSVAVDSKELANLVEQAIKVSTSLGTAAK